MKLLSFELSHVGTTGTMILVHIHTTRRTQVKKVF